MLGAAAPSEGVDIPGDPSEGQNRKNEQVQPQPPVLRQPQAGRASADERQGKPFPDAVVDQRVKQKANQIVDDEQPVAAEQRALKISGDFPAGTGHFLMEEICKKLHDLTCFLLFSASPFIMPENPEESKGAGQKTSKDGTIIMRQPAAAQKDLK